MGIQEIFHYAPEYIDNQVCSCILTAARFLFKDSLFDPVPSTGLLLDVEKHLPEAKCSKRHSTILTLICTWLVLTNMKRNGE